MKILVATLYWLFRHDLATLYFFALCLHLLDHHLDSCDNYIHRRQCPVADFSTCQDLDLRRDNLDSVWRSLAIPKPLNRCQLLGR